MRAVLFRRGFDIIRIHQVIDLLLRHFALLPGLFDNIVIVCAGTSLITGIFKCRRPPPIRSEELLGLHELPGFHDHGMHARQNCRSGIGFDDKFVDARFPCLQHLFFFAMTADHDDRREL